MGMPAGVCACLSSMASSTPDPGELYKAISRELVGRNLVRLGDEIILTLGELSGVKIVSKHINATIKLTCTAHGGL